MKHRSIYGRTRRRLENRLLDIGLSNIHSLASNFPYNAYPGNDAVTWTGYATLGEREYQLYSYFPMSTIVKEGARRYEPDGYQMEIVPDRENMGGNK